MLLQTRALTKDYGTFRALDALDLEIAPGEIFGLLGPNGSGKSTALRILLGFLRPTHGTAFIASHDCWFDGVRARRHVAYLPGELRLYETMTGRQLVRFLARLRGGPVGGDLDRLARRFDIDLDRPLAQLSSGMKRKVALLSVLIPNTPLVILDEPTNTLDPTMRDELLAQVAEARSRGQAVLFSSHVLAEVEQVCDRVGILRRGRLVHLQRLADLRQGRFVHARFEHARDGRPALEPPPPDLSGISALELRDLHLTLEYSGPLPPLLDWLARLPLAELRLEPLGLAGIYRRLHGAEAE
jgi:ABC-2 type transport system ATP-binding protein